MDAVHAQLEDVPYDSENPVFFLWVRPNLFSNGYGLFHHRPANAESGSVMNAIN